MNHDNPAGLALIDSILHPTDFSETSLVAFHHALKAALTANSTFVLLHVTADESGELMDFPRVRETLERWGLIPADSPRSAVPALGIGVSKVVARGTNPVKSVLRYLDEHVVDMIVLAAHMHDGRMAWLRHSLAEPVARRSHQMTLFIPEGVPGFVSPVDGSISLTSILVPIAGIPSPQPAVEAAVRTVRRLGLTAGTFTLLHVGTADHVPDVQTPEVSGWQWNRVTRSGDVIQEIDTVARETNAGLIVMSTDGRHGFLDAFRGSHSERVLRHGAAPLLAVPADSIMQARLNPGAH